MERDGLNGPFRLITDTGAAKRTEIPLDHYCRENAECMAMTHNTIFRGFNTVYNHARAVRAGTQEAADFLQYCHVVYDFVHCHHLSEEMYYFPMLEEATHIPGLMAGNIEQHQVFEEALEDFRRYVTETRPTQYDAEMLRSIIDTLVEPLETHLHDEIPSILDLHRLIDSQQLKKIYGRMYMECGRMKSKFRMAPYVFGCQDNVFLLDGRKVKFPEAPSFAPYCVALFVAPWNSRLWKFNPSDMHGIALKISCKPLGIYGAAITDMIMAVSVCLMLATLLFMDFGQVHSVAQF